MFFHLPFGGRLHDTPPHRRNIWLHGLRLIVMENPRRQLPGSKHRRHERLKKHRPTKSNPRNQRIWTDGSWKHRFLVCLATLIFLKERIYRMSLYFILSYSFFHFHPCINKTLGRRFLIFFSNSASLGLEILKRTLSQVAPIPASTSFSRRERRCKERDLPRKDTKNQSCWGG